MAEENINLKIVRKGLDEALSRYALTCRDEKSYIRRVRRFLTVAGISAKNSAFSDAGLKKYYTAAKADFMEKEAGIDAAVMSLARGARVIAPADRGKTADAVIKDGPGLVILDGGPGSGKSTGLGNAMNAMGAPVICLGATKQAAQTLFGDMEEKKAAGIVVKGGLTVDQLFDESRAAERADFEKMFAQTPKPTLMVDEAGLLDHDQMLGVLNYARVHGAKIILAGDSRQIPPGKGQPFVFLTETLKNTTCYANAPYVYRQGNFADKAITSGIYKGFCSDKNEINEAAAVEFLKAAPGNGGMHDVPTAGGKTFSDYLTQDYFKGGNPPPADPVAAYVADLAKMAKTFKSDGDLKAVLDKGPSAEGNYDAYLCAVLVLQAKGVRGYETRGMLKQQSADKGDGDLFASIAADFAKDYGTPDSFAKGMLAITATKEEAAALNETIRRAIAAGNGGKLPDREPVNAGGKLKLLSHDEIAALKEKGKKVVYAYAMDVRETQGLSQKGKVILAVSERSQRHWQGGHVLVGATRHKGNEDAIEIRLSGKADKKEFFERSVMQNASARINEDYFHEKLYEGLTGDKNWREMERTAKRNRISERISARQAEMAVAKKLKECVDLLSKEEKASLEPVHSKRTVYGSGMIARRKANGAGR